MPHRTQPAICPEPCTVTGAKIGLESDAGHSHPSRPVVCPLSLPGHTTPGGETEASPCKNCCHPGGPRSGTILLGHGNCLADQRQDSLCAEQRQAVHAGVE